MSSIANIISDFGTMLSSAWSVISDNIVLSAMIIVPVGIMVITGIFALIRGR